MFGALAVADNRVSELPAEQMFHSAGRDPSYGPELLPTNLHFTRPYNYLKNTQTKLAKGQRACRQSSQVAAGLPEQDLLPFIENKGCPIPIYTTSRICWVTFRHQPVTTPKPETLG
jgi:hypothetical protein